METNHEFNQEFISSDAPSPIIPALFYGGIIGLFQILVTYFTQYSAMSEDWESAKNTPLGIITYVVILALLIIYIIRYRDKKCNGYITYGKAFGASMLAVFFYSIIIANFTYIYLNFNPEIMDAMGDLVRKQIAIKMPDASPEDIEEKAALAQKFQSPLMLGVFSLLGQLLMGLIFSCLAAAFKGLLAKK